MSIGSTRQDALAVLNRQVPEFVPWLGDLSYWISYMENSGRLADKYQGAGQYHLYRDLGVGFYLQGYFPFQTHQEGIEFRRQEDGNAILSSIITPAGTLREVQQYLPESYCYGCTEHYVKDWRDLKVIRYLYEHTHYTPDYQLANDRYDLIGDNGLVLCYLPKSPLMEMIALLAGVEAVTYAELDAPEEVEETLAVIGRKHDQAAQIAVDSPAECLMIPENLSSEVVGKPLFEKYMRRYEETWSRRIHNAGKYSFIHMDGTLKGLIAEVASTGFDVLEALTPAPVGDIPMQDISKWVARDQTIIWGGLPGVYFTDLIRDEDFDRFVIDVLAVMKQRPRYVLGVADQVPPGARWERIQRVQTLVRLHGRWK